MSVLAAGMGATSGWIFGKLIDNGITNVLCVESLPHGTNLKSYVSIRFSGGNPRYGGSQTGSTKGFHLDATQGFFYVFKDSAFDIKENIPSVIKTILAPVCRRFYPRMHAFFSGYNCINTVLHINQESNHRAIKILRVFIGVVGGTITVCVTPILKFRFSQIDQDRFKNDPQYGGMAYKTSRKIEAWRLGTIGSLLTGINRDLPSRIKAHPAQFLLGIVQLSAAVALCVIATYAVVSMTPTLPLVLALGIPGAAGFLVA